MGYFVDSFKAMAGAFRNIFRPPVTVEYPQVIRPRPERYRASFALLHEADGDEACIGCLACERICPSQVIAVKGSKRESAITGKKRGYADDFLLDQSACIFCELCVQVCPADAIVMTREPEEPGYSRESLVLTMERLYANEKGKHRTWADGTKLMEMQTPPKPPKLAEGAKPPETKNLEGPKPAAVVQAAADAKAAEAAKAAETKTPAAPAPEAKKPEGAA